MNSHLFLFIWFLASSFFYGPFYVQAEALVKESYRGFSPKKVSIKARQDILKQATKDVSLKYIKQLIGESKTQGHRSVIDSNVLRQHAKYILFLRGDSFRSAKNGYTMLVKMKISIKNLRELLLAEGLLYKVGGPPTIIPMISFIDKVNRAELSWWTETSSANAYLYEYGIRFGEQLKEQLFKRGFYLISPLKYQLQKSLPRILRVDNLKEVDYQDMAMFFGGAVVIRGRVRISYQDKNQRRSGRDKKKGLFKIDIQLEGIHSSNGRVIAEVIRSYNTELGTFNQVVFKKLVEVYRSVTEDLSAQLHESWRQGTFGSSLVKLILNGSLDYPQLKQFKILLTQNMGEIKQVRERLFEPSRITLDLDSDTSPQKLANYFKTRTFPRFKIEVSHIEDNRVELNVSGL